MVFFPIATLIFAFGAFLAVRAAVSTFSGRPSAYHGGCHRGRTPFRPVSHDRWTDPCIARRRERYAELAPPRRSVSGSTLGAIVFGLAAIGLMLGWSTVALSRKSHSVVTHGFQGLDMPQPVTGGESVGFGASYREHENGPNSHSHRDVSFRFNWQPQHGKSRQESASPAYDTIEPPRRVVAQTGPPQPTDADSGIMLEDDGTAPAPQARPAWVDAPPKMEDDRYTTVAATDFFPNVESCREQLREKVVAEFRRYVQRYGEIPSGLVAPPDLVQNTVKREWIEIGDSERLKEILERTVVPSGEATNSVDAPGRMYRLHVQLGFSDGTPGVRSAYRAALVRSRAEYAAIGFGAAVVLLGAVGVGSRLLGGKWPR